MTGANPMVIGGAGFVGSHLVDRLLAEGRPVDVVDDLSTGSLGNLAEARASRSRPTIHTLDIGAGDLAALVGIRRPDVIFHLGLLTPGQQTRDADGSAIAGLLAVLEASRIHGVDKVVVALPAGDLYGEVPARELPVKESRPFQVRALRGVLAKTVTELLAVYRDEHAVEHTALAMTTVYGPRQRPGDGVVAAFASTATSGRPVVVHGDGRQTRDLLFVDDAVDALVRAGQRGGGLVINVGTGVQTSMRDLAVAVTTAVALRDDTAPVAITTVATAAGRRPGPVRIAVSAARARIHLQWSCWTDLTTGLDATVAAYVAPSPATSA